VSKSDEKNYTDEVLQALQQRGHVIPGTGPLAQVPEPPVPEGHLRFHIAVEETVVGGTAPAAHVAQQLRDIADQIDPREVQL
jgi:hypothetical protein